MSDVPFLYLFGASLIAETLRQTYASPWKLASEF